MSTSIPNISVLKNKRFKTNSTRNGLYLEIKLFEITYYVLPQGEQDNMLATFAQPDMMKEATREQLRSSALFFDKLPNNTKENKRY